MKKTIILLLLVSFAFVPIFASEMSVNVGFQSGLNSGMTVSFSYDKFEFMLDGNVLHSLFAFSAAIAADYKLMDFKLGNYDFQLFAGASIPLYFSSNSSYFGINASARLNYRINNVDLFYRLGLGGTFIKEYSSFNLVSIIGGRYRFEI